MMTLKNSHIFTLFVFIAMALYAISLPYDFFLYDDYFHILGNDKMDNFSFRNILAFWIGEDATKIPITYNVWQMLAFIFGKYTALPFRHIGVVFHALNSFLVYYVLQEFHYSRKKESRPQWQFILAALFFLVHPLQIESIVWISSLKGVLSTFWGLIALIFFIRSQEEKNKLFNIMAITVFTTLAMLSKPSAASLPLLYIFFDRFVYEHKVKEMFTRNGHYIFFGFAFYLLHTAEFNRKVFEFEVSINSFILMILSALKFYFSKAILPINLSFDYQLNYTYFIQFLKRESGALRLTVFISLIIIWVTGMLSFSKKYRPIAIFLATFIILCCTNLGLIPFDFQNISTVADRYLYFSLFGFSLAIYYIFDQLSSIPLKYKTYTISALLLGNLILSIFHIPNWEDNSDYFQHSLKSHPGSAILHQSKALSLMSEREVTDPGVETHLLRALEIDSGNESDIYDKLLLHYGKSKKITLGEDAVRKSGEKKINISTNSQIQFYLEAEYIALASEIVNSTRNSVLEDPNLMGKKPSKKDILKKEANLKVRRALEEKLKKRGPQTLFYAYYQTGLLYRDNKNPDEALYYLEEAEKYARSESDKKLLQSEMAPLKILKKEAKK